MQSNAVQPYFCPMDFDHTVGAYAYHFWMRDMIPIRHGNGSQHPHHQSESYRKRSAVSRRLMNATSSWASSPKECCNIWLLLSATPPGLISILLSARFRRKNRLRNGSYPTPCVMVGRNFSSVHPKAESSRNSSPPKFTLIASATPIASDGKKRYERSTLQY